LHRNACVFLLKDGLQSQPLSPPSHIRLDIYACHSHGHVTVFNLVSSFRSTSQPIYHFDSICQERTHISLSSWKSTNSVKRFQNIFYAEDTSRQNRFAPPGSLTYHQQGTIVDATAADTWCLQGVRAAPLPITKPITNMSENHLSLDIARPSGMDASAKLPVLVWMHGGERSTSSTRTCIVSDNGNKRRYAWGYV